jgi:hypothetical protein
VLLVVPEAATALKATSETEIKTASQSKVANLLGIAQLTRSGVIAVLLMAVKTSVRVTHSHLISSVVQCAFRNASAKKDTSEIQIQIAFLVNRAQFVSFPTFGDQISPYQILFRFHFQTAKCGENEAYNECGSGCGDLNCEVFVFDDII